jgi:recombination protein RecA
MLHEVTWLATATSITVVRAMSRHFAIADRAGEIRKTGMDATQLIRRLTPGPSPASSGILRWTFPDLAGRLVEISGNGDTAVLTAACALIRDAQRHTEPAVWIAAGDSTFFPPDAAASGIDLNSLILIRARDTASAARSADRILRSAGFGLIVVDLGKDNNVPLPTLTRLSGLARRHHAVVLFITEKSDTNPTLGSLISLAARTRREKVDRDRYRWSLVVTKDKRGAPASAHREECRGPAGLR